MLHVREVPGECPGGTPVCSGGLVSGPTNSGIVSYQTENLRYVGRDDYLSKSYLPPCVEHHIGRRAPSALVDCVLCGKQVRARGLHLHLERAHAVLDTQRGSGVGHPATGEPRGRHVQRPSLHTPAILGRTVVIQLEEIA